MSLEERIKTDGCTEENLSELMNSADGDALFDDPTIQCILVKALLHGTSMNERVIDKLKTCHPTISSKDKAECILSEEWRITDTVGKGHPFIFRFFISKVDMFSEINQEFLLKRMLNDEHFGADASTQRSIISAIYEGNFANKEKALQIIAKVLDVFADKEATKYLQLEIDALSSKTFSSNQIAAPIDEKDSTVNKYDKYVYGLEYDYGLEYEEYELRQAMQQSYQQVGDESKFQYINQDCPLAYIPSSLPRERW
jgi:hypothetical protein